MLKGHKSSCSMTHTIVLLLFWNFSGTSRVSRYQKGKTRKGKTNLDLLEQKIVSDSGICWAICNSYSLRPPARSPPAWRHMGSPHPPIVHTWRVPPCMVQSRLGAFPRYRRELYLLPAFRASIFNPLDHRRLDHREFL